MDSHLIYQRNLPFKKTQNPILTATKTASQKISLLGSFTPDTKPNLTAKTERTTTPAPTTNSGIDIILQPSYLDIKYF